MKATELRIGNWWTNGDENYIVDINTLWDIFIAEEQGHSHLWEPIPLTEEWLLKLNGVHQPWGWVIDGILIHYNHTMPEGRMFWIELGNGKRIDLPFVHTIQNFFALTGTELTIKE